MYSTLNRQQREALAKLYNRFELFVDYNGMPTSKAPSPCSKPMTYRQLRRKVIIGRDCAMLQWCGMWLGIEHDGYVHS